MQRVYKENEWGKVSKRIVTTGPNDARHVVQVSSKFFFLSCLINSNNYIWIQSIGYNSCF